MKTKANVDNPNNLKVHRVFIQAKRRDKKLGNVSMQMKRLAFIDVPRC
ncbi:hypothetical protein [Bartonella sp. B1098]|nr:hypothetical protein [Bartonella sp. B1098]